ncbi:MAG: type I-U CRISPR-associated protein Csx17 [Deltaproteobacteria bacterium]|nr:type I-U CRISPR-associated protein Csx17 [Deltaproteobacteria bacterium]
MSIKLNVVHFLGINTHCLGSYLMGLGLLSACAKQWPSIRGCWRDGQFVLVGKEITRENTSNYLKNSWKPTDYSERWWANPQKTDTKQKTSEAVWRERNIRSDEATRILDSHLVGMERNQFNPLFGTGGNIGKRDLAKGFKDARRHIEKNSKLTDKWLMHSLFNTAIDELPKFSNASTWFVTSNKRFNSGQQNWFRDGRISPWSYLLALEGAFLFKGSISKRLGSNRRGHAAFPFMATAKNPTTAGGIGKSNAEMWAPLWSRPATFNEVTTLISRGIVQIGQKGAAAPHEFALAALGAGVDFGIDSFAAFELRETTSSQVKEAIPRENIQVTPNRKQESHLLMELLPWLDRMPNEPSNNQKKGHFTGFRGALEEAIRNVTAEPEEPDNWRRLLWLASDTQMRIDRNKAFRSQMSPIQYLSPAWFDRCWPEPTTEIRLARAVASIGVRMVNPIMENIFGIELKPGRSFIEYSKTDRPPRVVWTAMDPIRGLAAIMERRLIDADTIQDIPLKSAIHATVDDLNLLLSEKFNIDVLGHWLAPFSLINWSNPGQPNISSNFPLTFGSGTDGLYLWTALFRPFFHPKPIMLGSQPLFPEHLRPSSGLARRLYSLLRQGEWSEAYNLARTRYLAANRAIIPFSCQMAVNEELVTASLLIPLSSFAVRHGIRHWLIPEKSQN